MRKSSYSLIFLAFASFFIWACQKGINWGDEVTITPVTVTGPYEWSATINDTTFQGCIDTAYYEINGGLKVLQIIFSDRTGNSILIALASTTGYFPAGTYSPPSANGTIAFTGAGNSSYSVSGTNDAFSFQASTINDSTIVGTFTANLSNTSLAKTLKITNGKIKALIGKANPCTGAGNLTGGGTDTLAAINLIRSLGKCSFVVVKGTYTAGKDLNSTNEAQVQVNVTKTGKYNISTVNTNGMVFTSTGTFNATGTQTLILKGSGNPSSSGIISIPLTVGNTSCNFQIIVQ